MIFFSYTSSVVQRIRFFVFTFKPSTFTCFAYCLFFFGCQRILGVIFSLLLSGPDHHQISRRYSRYSLSLFEFLFSLSFSVLIRLPPGVLGFRVLFKLGFKLYPRFVGLLIDQHNRACVNVVISERIKRINQASFACLHNFSANRFCINFNSEHC